MNNNPNHINIEAAKSAAYAMVKYAHEAHPDMDFQTCIKTFKGGVLRIWIENMEGMETGDDYRTGDVNGN